MATSWVPDSSLRTIASRQHAVVGRFRAAASRLDGTADILLDGPHLIRDALAAGLRPQMVATTAASRAVPEIANLIAALASAGTDLVSVSQGVMDVLSPVRTPTGIVAIAPWTPATLQDALAGDPALVVAVVGVQDPGNVGAVIRAADAAGATGVLVCDGSASPFGWKALRGAMGSTFRVPVLEGVAVASVVAEARHAGLDCIAAVASAGLSLYVCDLRRPVLLLMGGEGPGLSAATVASADRAAHIPMASGVESLNVAVAAGVMLFEAARQRAARRGGQRS